MCRRSLVLLRSVLCWRWLDVLTQEPPLAPVQQDSRNRPAAAKRRGRGPAAATPPALEATLRGLSALDAKIHAAALDAFGARVAAFGGAAKVAADVAFFDKFKFAAAAACLACRRRADARAVLPFATPALCADLAPTCAELPAHEAAIEATVDVPARRRGDARAEAALAAVISDCGRFETVLVCPRRNAALCAEGPLCLPPRRPCPTGARAWLARWLPPWRHEAACDAAAARGRRELWLP